MGETALRHELAMAAKANELLRRQIAEKDREIENLRLRHDNVALRQEAETGRIKIKIGKKRTVVVEGHRDGWPTVLYKDEWPPLLDAADRIRAFIREHDAELRASSEDPPAAVSIRRVR